MAWLVPSDVHFLKILHLHQIISRDIIGRIEVGPTEFSCENLETDR